MALLQFPNPHDLVSGAVIHASQAEDALAVVVLVGLMFKLQVGKRPRCSTVTRDFLRRAASGQRGTLGRIFHR